MKLFNEIKVRFALSQLELPSSDQLLKYTNAFSSEYKTIAPLILNTNLKLKEHSVQTLTDFFTSFLNYFCKSTGIRISKSEMQWYIFCMVIIAYEEDVEQVAEDLYNMYNNLPVLLTTSKVIRYIQYTAQSSMIHILLYLKKYNEAIEMKKKTEKFDDEIIHLPNNIII